MAPAVHKLLFALFARSVIAPVVAGAAFVREPWPSATLVSYAGPPRVAHTFDKLPPLGCGRPVRAARRRLEAARG